MRTEPLLLIAMAGAMLLPVGCKPYQEEKEKQAREKSAAHLRQINDAIRAYVADESNEGRFPASLQELVDRGLLKAEVLHPPKGRGEYVYIPGYRGPDEENKVIVYESLQMNDGKGANVISLSGEVTWVTPERLEELLAHAQPKGRP